MRNIFYTLIIAFSFSSCIQEKDLFIPTHQDYPTNALKSFIPSKSLDVELENSKSYKLSTDYNSYVEIDKGAFLINNEGSTNYDLKLIELKDYVDYILQNVDHESSIGITNTIYSFYIGAEENGNLLDFNEGKSMRIRFTHDQVAGELALGFGQTNNNSLKWEYFSSNIDKRVSYIAWEKIGEDGTMKTEYGYEIIVNSPGWYSLVAKQSLPADNNTICVDLQDKFNAENTAVYLLMNEWNYMRKLTVNSNNTSKFCISNLPASIAESYKLLSISKVGDNEYYYYETELQLNNESQTIQLDPGSFSLEEIKNALQNL